MKFPALPPPTPRRSISYNLGDYEVLSTSPEQQYNTVNAERFDVVSQSPNYLLQLQRAAERAALMNETNNPSKEFANLGARAMDSGAIDEFPRGNNRIDMGVNLQSYHYPLAKNLGTKVHEMRKGACN